MLLDKSDGGVPLRQNVSVSDQHLVDRNHLQFVTLGG